MCGLVQLDVDVPETGVGKMKPDFPGFVGVHPLDHLFPFLVVAREAVVFVDDDEIIRFCGVSVDHPGHAAAEGIAFAEMRQVEVAFKVEL